ncbi:diacylglycerol kinase [Vagococcus penaei]|uniref:Diacylglycerol kinase n=1 Tax=Vagococcus penaei TaxID=633807 RepID=A0A1Q2D3G9_9ENTE|nr:diacylglycerol kinase [Vagococcus penaei]AQP52922.1 diacylglycerol kinase [Vagococcus penaei]RSU02621.1 diacylglycerol kinase [Vagococcus penaei]
MKARLIYNPTSGKEQIKKNVAEILIILESAGYEASTFATTPEPLSAQKEAKRVAEAGFDLIMVAGGDGTINEVINGIAPLETRPKVAIIPAGTTNDFARALHVPRDNMLSAAKVILKNQTIKADIGKAANTYFMNIAAAGHLTELTYEVPSHLKSVFGYLAYLVKGAEMLPRIKPINVRLTYDDGVYEGEASMFFLGLTNSIGGFETISPDAQLNDGKFSLIIVKTANILEIMRLVALMINGGKHINDSKIEYIKTSKLHADTTDDNFKMMINLDGEYGGDVPMTFTNLKQHIEFYANLDEIPDSAVSDELDSASDEFVKQVEILTKEDINGDGKISNEDKA